MPVLQFIFTDSRQPFQPTSIRGAALAGSHLIEQSIIPPPRSTQEAATLLAEVATSLRTVAEATGITFGGAIGDDTDFWRMLCPVVKGSYLRDGIIS